MSALVTVHQAAAVALVALTLVVGVWGLARTRSLTSREGGRRARIFAQLLQLSHTLVIATGLIGVALYIGGERPDDALHARVYGPFMLVAIVAAYGYRTKDPVTNIRIFSGASLIIFLLGLRALATGS